MKRFWTLILMLALFLTGCGGGAASMEPTTNLEIGMTEFMFEPAMYAIPAGEEVTLKLVNKGGILHDFIILKKGSTIKTPFKLDENAEIILFNGKVSPNSEETFTISIAEPGEYLVLCGISGHTEAGMTGKLIVK